MQATDKWYYDGNCIEVVNSFNYLGLLLNYNGKFTVTEKLIASQGCKAMFARKRSCKNLILNVECVYMCLNVFMCALVSVYVVNVCLYVSICVFICLCVSMCVHLCL